MKIASTALAALTVAIGCLAPHSTAVAQAKSVAITSIVEHPALDAVRDGVQDELKAKGFEVGRDLKIIFKTAQGNPTIAAQIARQFVGEAPDVIVAISTPSAQAAVSATKTIPVVFAAVTDPTSAKLVAGPGASGTNVTGVSDLAPVADQLVVIKELLPAAKKIGVVYSPGEANSVAQIAILTAAAARQGYTIVEAPAVRSADVQSAARSLIGKVDVIYLPADNAVTSAIEGVVAIATQAKLPVFAADEASVERGAIATVGFDYYKVGRQSGALVAKILRGEAAGSLPWQLGAGTELSINTAAAKAVGVAVPEALLSRAKKIPAK